MPIHGGALFRKYHGEVAIEEGWRRDHVLQPDNGDSLLFTKDSVEFGNVVPNGAWLVDQTGNLVSGVVVKDRLVLAEHGLVVVILTIDRKTGGLLTSPDIVTRGFIYIRDSEQLMDEFRAELRRAVGQRFKRIDLDRFKAEIKDHITHFLYEQTGRSPIVIPVVNVIGGRTERNEKGGRNTGSSGAGDQPAEKTEEQIKAEQQKRFQEMRARLLGADQPN